MEIKQLVLLVAALTLCSFSMSAIRKIGRAAYYGPPYVGSACFGRRNDRVMVAAASQELYGHRAICGKKYRIKFLNADYKTSVNPCKHNNKVVVTMLDYCPGCKGKHIDLSKDAFDSIAHLSAGRIKIDFELV